MRIRRHQLAGLTVLLALLAAALVGIGAGQPNPAARAEIAAPVATPAAAPVAVPEAVTPAAHGSVWDLPDIRFQREFRVLIAAPSPSPDRLAAPDFDHRVRELIERFADEEFLLPRWITVSRREDLVPALMQGKGDLIGSPMRIHEYRDRGAEFTVPVGHLREVLVGRAGERITHPRHLRGREIALAPRSSFWPKLHALRRQVPDIEARMIPEHIGPAVVLQRVKSARYDLAVVDPGPVELGASSWEGLRALAGINSSGNLSLGVHPGATALKDALNDFLTREQLAQRELPRRTVDLDGIKRSGVLRVLTRNNAGSYFIWRGRPLGFEFELITRFAKKHKLSVEMVTADGRDELLPSLLRGEGDVVAAGFAVTPERRGNGVTFTRPYKESYQVVVTRAGDDTLNGPVDLSGRTVTVHASSPAWKLLERHIANGLDISLDPAPEDLEAEEIISRVASGRYDVTVADTYSVKVAMTWRDDIHNAFPLQGPVPIAWAVRRTNSKLLKSLNEFIEREYRQLFYNIIHARYFENPRTIRSHVKNRAVQGVGRTRLSPYDEIVQRHADKHGFDWALIVAMMYRESRFNPEVVSWAGARGLMQVLPTTARRFGVTDLESPEMSIIAGVRMLDWLYQRMEPDLTVKDRTWFALAAYNAGLGHLIDARRLARERGLNADRWFGNVEKAMLLLSQPAYYRKARHGYVRGAEPVTYVRDIRTLYNAYRAALPS